MYKGKLYVPQCLTNIILQEYNDVHGHFSQTHTQKMISEWFYWLQIIYNIHEYYKKCDTYQHFKSDTYKVAGICTPLPVLDYPW